MVCLIPSQVYACVEAWAQVGQDNYTRPFVVALNPVRMRRITASRRRTRRGDSQRIERRGAAADLVERPDVARVELGEFVHLLPNSAGGADVATEVWEAWAAWVVWKVCEACEVWVV